MNERIDELMIEAGARFEMMNWVHYDDFEYKKFAQLIVKECIQVSGPEDSYTDEWFKAKVDSVQKIKKHFGVER
jgi:hypothetical protein